MGKKILKFITHYRVIGITVSLTLIILGLPYLTDLAIQYLSPPKALENLIKYAIKGLAYFIWGYINFTNLRHIIYSDITGGRSYESDHAKYKRTYTELVSYFKNANPYKIDSETLPVESWKQADGVILGKVGKHLVKRPSTAPGNLCVFGLPGSHKTTSQIIPTALQFGGSCLVIDIKGDVLHWTKDKRKIKVFNPENAAESCHFNPFDGIEKMSITERIQHVENLSYILLEEDPKDKYFIPGGRDYWCGIALYMLNENIDVGFDEVCRGISLGDPFTWTMKIIDSDCEEAKSYVASYAGTNEVNVAGVYNTICKGVRPFISGDLALLLNKEGDQISPSSLEERYDIYIEIPQDKIKIYAPITTIIVQNFMTAFTRRKDSSTGEKIRPIIFLLDEFPQLHFDFETLSMALSTLRSKSVTLFLAQQSIAQIESRYGEAHTREIIDTCAYLSIMSAQDPKSREFFQRIIGTQKVLKVSNSENSKDTSRSIQETREPIFQPEDFGNLGEDVVIYDNGKYIRAQKTNCYE